MHFRIKLTILLLIILGLSIYFIKGGSFPQDSIRESLSFRVIKDQSIVQNSNSTLIQIEASNGFNYPIELTLRLNGYYLLFSNHTNSVYFENELSQNSTLQANQRINYTFMVRLHSKMQSIPSVVQILYFTVLDNNSKIIWSNKNWIWFYSNLADLSLPQIPISLTDIDHFPLFTSQNLLITYYLYFDTSNSGKITFSVYNMIEESQDYLIAINYTNSNPELLQLDFDKAFLSGYSCSLVCGDMNDFIANFKFLLPNDTQWLVFPISLVIYLNSEQVVNTSVLIPLNNGLIYSQIIDSAKNLKIRTDPIEVMLELDVNAFPIIPDSDINFQFLADNESLGLIPLSMTSFESGLIIIIPQITSGIVFIYSEINPVFFAVYRLRIENNFELTEGFFSNISSLRITSTNIYFSLLGLFFLVIIQFKRNRHSK